ncbi:peptide-methionine (R)-S-oxide reductase MsrB [Inquilinus sp. CAU 1745]|uniref:peptide-methionine (R)-S-oxide reductase MsrB n=1 Tax=Inquilinus sp. CAU 1745 TaxID=3140369 RepID=UPI00325B12C7
MLTRRHLGMTAAAAVALSGAGAMKLFGSSAKAENRGNFPVSHTEEEWRELLTDAEYRVLRDHGTERSGSSPLNQEHRAGIFICAGCNQPVYSSETKFESGTGWPSFYAPIEGGVGTSEDRKLFMVRTEVHCSRCGGHLGHVFEDGPPPTGLRYCMNGVAMDFVPEGEPMPDLLA